MGVCEWFNKAHEDEKIGKHHFYKSEISKIEDMNLKIDFTAQKAFEKIVIDVTDSKRNSAVYLIKVRVAVY